MPSLTNNEIYNYIQKIMKEYSLDCYVVFNSDRHLNEYIDKKDMRVEAISRFSGSNGTVVISDEPCLITDSRYYIQAETQSLFPLYKGKLSEYIISKSYKRVSFDTRTISSSKFKQLMEKFQENEIQFIDTPYEYQSEINNQGELINQGEINNKNELIDLEELKLIDFINFEDKYPIIKDYIAKMGFEIDKLGPNVTGSSYKDKINRIRQLIGKRTLIVTELDTIAWILNLRGSDIQYNPVFYSYLIINQETTMIFCNKKIKRDIRQMKYEEFESYISHIKGDVVFSGDCNQYLYSKIENSRNKGKCSIIDDVRSLQAQKNDTELCGMVLAYFFDGWALTELFAFIHNNMEFTEEEISDELDRLKRRFKGYVQPSFETISSTGSNAAIVHHKASTEHVDKDKIYLIDSGSQYYFGTTDTTRTLFFGKNIDEKIKHDYTLVLKGQLNAMIQEYSRESKYSDIDEISRRFLKDEGKDFGHATGHGVGHFLCVHEHPPSVYPEAEDKIQENHVFSIEPGFYKDGEYGIRIENLVVSKFVEDRVKLVNITLVPYQNKMVEVDILTEEEKRFYNESNMECLNTLKRCLSFEGFEFLKQECGTIQ